MRIIEADTQNALPLGRQGEKGVTTVAFDVHGWLEEFGAGTFVLLHKRNGDDAGYPVKTVLEDGKVLWTVDEADVFRPGTGVAQLIMMVDGKVAKSGLYKTSTSQALNETKTAPEAWKAWVDSIFEAVGTYPRINTVGNWEVFEGGAWKDTGVSAKGKVPVKGVDYFDGRDGRDGRDGTDGRDGVDGLPGRNGTDGHTPVMTGVKEGKTNTILADGVPLISIKDAEGGGVSDVTVNGASIVQDGVAEIPIARTRDVFGLMLVRNNTGITVGADGQLLISSATETNINGRNNSSGGTGRYYAPIVPYNLDYAVKCALADGKGIAYTEAERKAVRDRTNTRAGKLFLISDDVLESDIRKLTYDFTGRNLKNIHIIFTSAPSQSNEIRFYGTPNGLSDALSMYSCYIPISGYLVLDFCTESGFIYCNHRYGQLNSNNNTERLRGMGFEQGDYIEKLVFYGSQMDFIAGLRIQIWGC